MTAFRVYRKNKTLSFTVVIDNTVPDGMTSYERAIHRSIEHLIFVYGAKYWMNVDTFNNLRYGGFLLDYDCEKLGSGREL